ncbi:hypothetical protein PV11_07317 [Exophiala sideris]|uniref:Transcription factor domain-containing protein n=1 Tax=Exophiala sideris TaxID=1016849 RepID=A0A0D1Y9W8_9EURO|nr:hypothetical protein PV11_07317 [Exophiala sideris]
MPQFLFVNKDADSASLTRSNAGEQSSINSHVQRGRRHKRSAHNPGRSAHRTRRPSGRDKDKADQGSEENDLPQSVASSAKTVSPEPVFIDNNSTSQSGVDSPQTSTLPSRPPKHNNLLRSAESAESQQKTNRPPKIDRVHNRAPGKRSGSEEKAVVLLNSPQPSHSPRDISQLTSNSIDPFGLSVVTLSPQVASLCRYFCEKFHPSVFYAESSTLSGQYTHQSAALAAIQRAMQNEVEMNAILACMAARIENVDMVPGQGTDKFMANALVAMRRNFTAISSASKHQLLLIIFHLYAGEAYRQNWKAARVHMKAAKALFDSWGGLDYVPDHHIRELFIIGDGNVAACLLEPCELPCSHDPGPYWTVIPAEFQLAPPQDLSYIAPALQDILTDGYLPDDLVEAVLETVECTWVLNHAQTGSPEVKKHAARWLLWRNSAIRWRLLAMKYPDATHDAIRMALFMWVMTAMVLLGLKRVVGLNAPKLMLALKVGRWPYEWQGLFELKMWVLTIGAMGSVIDSDEEKWFVEQIFEIGLADNIRRFREMSPDMETVDVLKRFQERFFYYEPTQRPRLERLATLIHDSRDFGSSTASMGTRSSFSDVGRKSRSPT